MVVQSETIRFIANNDGIIPEEEKVEAPKKVASPAPPQTTPDNTEFTL
jgi:hypothetical protein